MRIQPKRKAMASEPSRTRFLLRTIVLTAAVFCGYHLVTGVVWLRPEEGAESARQAERESVPPPKSAADKGGRVILAMARFLSETEPETRTALINPEAPEPVPPAFNDGGQGAAMLLERR